MKSTYSSLMQSKYFNPAFNSAIFDGPVRIYFAQFHESLALKIYFLIQQKEVEAFARAKDLSRASNANVLIMVYPSDDSFTSCVEESGNSKWVVENWNEDVVIAIRGVLEDNEIEPFMEFATEVLKNWNPKKPGTRRPELSLV